MSEAALQRQVAEYLDAVLPDECTWFHVPNGGSRNKAEAGKLKSHGVKPGVADCILIYRGQVIAIELKTAKGRLSNAQSYWKTIFEAAGGWFYLCRSLDDVQAVLEACHITTKGRLSA